MPSPRSSIGATHVQGTMNGTASGCGNCNLIPLVCNLELKLGHTTVGREEHRQDDQLRQLHRGHGQPGADQRARRLSSKSAFAIRAGFTSAPYCARLPPTSTSSPKPSATSAACWSATFRARSNIAFKLQEKGWEEKLDDGGRASAFLARIKQMEFEGYELESADGSFELLIRQALAPETYFFKLDRDAQWSRTSRAGSGSQCAVKMTVDTPAGPQQAEVSASGPFDAIAGALRRCLGQVYPAVADIRWWTTRCACSIRARAPRPRCGC